jgi:hypothetical protein
MVDFDATNIRAFLLTHQTQLHNAVLGIAIFTSLSCLVYTILQRLRSKKGIPTGRTRPSTPDIEREKEQAKGKKREYGGMSIRTNIQVVSSVRYSAK